MMTPEQVALVLKYRENLSSCWDSFRERRLTRISGPVFSNSSTILNHKHFPDWELLEVAAACLLEGESAILERERNDRFIILGTTAINTYTREERFLKWPFIPLVMDTENYSIGLTRDSSGAVRMACAVKDILYDRRPSRSQDEYYLSEHGFETLPLIIGRLVREDSEYILIGQV